MNCPSVTKCSLYLALLFKIDSLLLFLVCMCVPVYDVLIYNITSSLLEQPYKNTTDWVT